MNVKEIDNIFLDPGFIVQFLELLNQYGLIDDISLRNALIRKEWIESKQKGEQNKIFKERTADKYFISEKAVEAVLYASCLHKSKGYDMQIQGNNNKILNELNPQITGNT